MLLERPGHPALHAVIDDHTDPWRRDVPWVVLQHGYARSHRFFQAWVPTLSRHTRVIRPDLRGFGDSPRLADPDREMTVEGLLDDVGAVIDHLGDAAPVHYVGESLSGLIALLFAARHPGRLRSLTLLSAPLAFPAPARDAFALGHPSWIAALRALGSRGWAERVGAATRFPPEADPGLVAWYAEESGKADVATMIAVARFCETLDAGPVLDRVTLPVLGLYPDGGPITGPQEARLRAGIPHIRMHHLPTGFHAIQVLMPDACARTVLEFCREVDGAGGRFAA
ncbi:MAG: alpha/beta hydrolase [Acetobacteraceae bacterium]|nr:alpha/beta hydrolase [Acetobacteraceae bacterium]